MIRCFLALDLPDALRPQLALVQGELKRSHGDVRWVAVGNIHLTLKFFGNVPDAEIDPLTQAAREVAAQQEPFQLQVTQAGAFPSMTSPGLSGWVWAGTSSPWRRCTINWRRPLRPWGTCRRAGPSTRTSPLAG